MKVTDAQIRAAQRKACCPNRMMTDGARMWPVVEDVIQAAQDQFDTILSATMVLDERATPGAKAHVTESLSLDVYRRALREEVFPIEVPQTTERVVTEDVWSKGMTEIKVSCRARKLQ